MTFRRTAGGGLAACASLSAVAALLVPGSSATATQSGRHAVSASKAATEHSDNLQRAPPSGSLVLRRAVAVLLRADQSASRSPRQRQEHQI